MDGSNVIELSADGVFDIPSIPVAAQSPSRPCCVARIADVGENKQRPRRVSIITVSDDDGTDDDDDDDGDDDEHGLVPPATRPEQEQELQNEHNGHNRSKATTGSSPKAAGTSEAVTERPASPGDGVNHMPPMHGPEYRVYKIEAPNAAPILEVVVSLSDDKLENKMNTTNNKPPLEIGGGHGRATPVPNFCPAVSVLPDGGRVVVDCNDPRPSVGGGRSRFSLDLPQRVDPGSASSFFWQGDLTVRASIAVG